MSSKGKSNVNGKHRTIYPDAWHLSAEEHPVGNPEDDHYTLVTITFLTENVTTKVCLLDDEAERLAEELKEYARFRCHVCAEKAGKPEAAA
jgi:hypothetical protein